MPSTQKDRKLYVEFVGQHTAGKTTIIRDIVDRDLLKPQNAIYPQKIERSHLHFSLNLPKLILLNLFDVIFVSLFFLKYAKYTWTNYHAAGRHIWKMVILHSYYSNFNFDIWMKDDLLHLLPRIEFRKKVSVSFALNIFFSRFAHLYDGLVFIDLPYEEMKARFEIRFENRPNRRRLNRELVYERAYLQNIILKSILIEQSKVPILVLDGLADLESKSFEVVKFIKEQVFEQD